MVTMTLLLVILRRMGVAADRCQQLREGLERLGAAQYDPPSTGAVVASILGLLTIPVAVIGDYYLLSSVVAYTCQLSGVTESALPRLLVPIGLVAINVAGSVNRARQSSGEDTWGEYTPRMRKLNPVIATILVLQVAAAVAQYVALNAVHPSPANGLVLLFLGSWAVVGHFAAWSLSGTSILLITKACRNSYRRLVRRRLSNALRSSRRDLFRHFQNFNAAADEYKRTHPGAAVPEIDQVIADEYNSAAGLQTPPPTTPPPSVQPPPTTPNTPTTPPTSVPPAPVPPGEPVNPYQPVDPNDQRF